MAADLTTLNALLDRVRKATGPDRGLDADLCVALWYVPGEPNAEIVFVWEDQNTLHFDLKGKRGGVEWELHNVTATTPALTGSIDAAAALVERMLGTDEIVVHLWGECEIYKGDKTPWEVNVKAEANTAPLAILAALLAALIVQEGK